MSRRGGTLWVLAGIAVVAVAVGIATSRHGGAHVLHGQGFTLRYPGSWRPLSAAALDALARRPLAELERANRKGVVTITRGGSAEGKSGPLMARELDAGFRKRLPDYRRVTTDILRTPAGRVFFFSYLRVKQRTLHTIAIVPAGDHSFVIDTASNPDAADAAAEIVAMIRSFRAS